MTNTQKHDATVLSNFVSGYRWLHFLTVRIETEAIAVYIYIIYNIIICIHVTTVTNKTIHTHEKIFSYNSIVYVHFRWLHGLHGYKVPSVPVFDKLLGGYMVDTNGYKSGYNE